MADMAYPVFVNTDGTALEGGQIFLGVAYSDPEAQPAPAFWDSALSIPAEQPLRTSGGVIVRNGTPADVFATDPFYSIRVRSRTGAVVWYKPIAGGTGPSTRLNFPVAGGPPGETGDTGPADNTYTTYAALLASDPARKSARLVPQAGETEPAGNFSYINGAWVRQSSDGIAFQQYGTQALPRNLFAKERERALSVMDFLSVADQNSIREKEFDYTREPRITAAINACFTEATPKSTRDVGRSVYLPDGGYPVGNLLFGTQSTTTQSAAPLGLFGDSKNGAELRAKPGLTGTLLQAWSLAGVELHSFALTNIGSSGVALDAEWKPGPGPSTQNAIEQIRVNGGSGPLLINLRNLNDTYPDMLTVGGTTPGQINIDMTQPGGLAEIHNSIWASGPIRFGAQNGAIRNCWGFGIEWAMGAINFVEVSGCYIYPIPGGPVIRSQSLDPFQAASALTFIATQFICAYGGSTASAVFDINAYSTIDMHGCQFITEGAINLLSATSRKAGASNVLVGIRGGTLTGPVTLNEPTGFEVEARGLMDDATAKMVTKNRSGTFTPVVRGGTTAGTATYSDQMGRWTREGNRVFVEISLAWSGHTGSGPISIPSLPFGNTSGRVGAQIGFSSNTFSGAVANASMVTDEIAFFNASGGAALNIPASGALALSLNYQVAA